jgi:hypothetical protein
MAIVPFQSQLRCAKDLKAAIDPTRPSTEATRIHLRASRSNALVWTERFEPA